MCRLYGFRANFPTKVECTLIHAQNALMIQSRADMRGLSHSDGWGLGYYCNGEPAVVRRAQAAFQDLHFPSTVERVHAHTVVAHVRRATVGQPSLENTHPFRHGPWIFAHNGTLTGFEQLREGLEREALPDLLEHRRGATDSELAFYWLLTRMVRAGMSAEAPCPDLDRLAELLGKAVGELAARCRETESERTARLNFLLTDGRVLLVTRWNNSLYWVERPGVHDCEICGIPHIQKEGEGDYRAAVIASEPISHEKWREVPERSIVAVTGRVEVRRFPIAIPV